MITKLLREPFVHFLIAGTMLFVLYEFTAADAARVDQDVINITTEDIGELREQWMKQHGEQANQETLSELIESLVYEEVMFREALRLGLDINDTIIRRRLIQKMEFLSANLSQLNVPDENALRSYYDKHVTQYAIEEKRSFTHIYFSRDRRAETMLDDARQLLEELKKTEANTRLAGHGDNFILQYDYRLRSKGQIARVFGREFADKLFELPTASWQGPLLSEYGAHLVRIQDVQPAHIPAYAELRDEVHKDLTQESLKQLQDDSYQALREAYQIKIESSLSGN